MKKPKDELTNAIATHGIRIDGVYRHFTGDLYIPTVVMVDANSGDLLVQYTTINSNDMLNAVSFCMPVDQWKDEFVQVRRFSGWGTDEDISELPYALKVSHSY